MKPVRRLNIVIEKVKVAPRRLKKGSKLDKLVSDAPYPPYYGAGENCRPARQRKGFVPWNPNQ